MNDFVDNETIITSEQQEMCEIASRNARALEEMLITYNSIVGISEQDASNVVDRCEQIIHCMKECFGA